jgi:shikimate dehydrogenase
VVLGAGGAARAVVDALARAGAAEVAVVNRSSGPAEQAAALAGPAGRVAGAAEAVPAADLVVNATPLGMTAHHHGAMPCDPAIVRAGAVVVDLIYDPLETPWLAALRGRDVVVTNGISMLVHQAARQFERWTGHPAPVDAMTGATARLLAERSAR